MVKARNGRRADIDPTRFCKSYELKPREQDNKNKTWPTVDKIGYNAYVQIATRPRAFWKGPYCALLAPRFLSQTNPGRHLKCENERFGFVSTEYQPGSIR